MREGLTGVNGAPFLNPFANQTGDALAYLQAAQVKGQVQDSEGTLRELTAVVSGEVYKMPAGPMMLAVGVEFLKDEASYNNNFALIRQAASSGLELAEDSSGDRRDNAIYAELNMPLMKTARAQPRVALRRLQRRRQHLEPEDRDALAADAAGPGARFVQHGLPRADAV